MNKQLNNICFIEDAHLRIFLICKENMNYFDKVYVKKSEHISYKSARFSASFNEENVSKHFKYHKFKIIS